MNPNALYRRYQELQEYVGWSEEDARRVLSLAPVLAAHLPALVDDFYAEIDRHPEARKVITGGAAQIERLKGTLLRWLQDLLAGPYDQDYVTRRWRVGWRHVEIGLDQVYTNVALSRLRRGLMRALDESGPRDWQEMLAVRRSLNTLLDLDLAIIEDAYQAEHIARQQESERRVIERLNKDLQHRVTELQTLLDVIPVGIAIAQDAACRFIHVNPAFARMLGLPAGANASMSAPNDRPAIRVYRRGQKVPPEEMPMEQAARGIEVRDAELDIVLPSGKTINLLGNAAPLLDERGQARGAVGAFLNITERRQSQERLLQAERLAAIGQMMTGLAHESGNALARSRACLEMLAWEVPDKPEAQDLIARIQKAQDHLQQLYEEVRGYAAPLKLEREFWNLAGIWRQAWQNLSGQRQGKEAELREELDGVDLEVQADQFRLDQVFRNILDNALAACPAAVEIRVQCANTELDGNPAVRIAFRDNGPGLSAEQRHRIFEPFFTTKTKGTGLGMAIAKRIVEAHGGRIKVGEHTGPGAEIVVILPRGSP
jgi:signal transduction histidine kinase